MGVFRAGTSWPDVIVAGLMAGLGVQGAAQVHVNMARARRAAPGDGVTAASVHAVLSKRNENAQGVGASYVNQPPM